MERFRSQPGSLLVLPTATVVEHIGHSLARERFPGSAARDLHMAQFLDRCASTAAAPAPLLDLFIEQALEAAPARFLKVGRIRFPPGSCRAV
jgi:hypothetical protein